MPPQRSTHSGEVLEHLSSFHGRLNLEVVNMDVLQSIPLKNSYKTSSDVWRLPCSKIHPLKPNGLLAPTRDANAMDVNDELDAVSVTVDRALAPTEPIGRSIATRLTVWERPSIHSSPLGAIANP